MNAFEPLVAPILEAFPELDAEDISFVPPPKLDMGDVAMRTFEAARKLRLPPPKVAAEIAERVSFGPSVQSVSTAGPYLNFRLDRGVFWPDHRRDDSVRGFVFRFEQVRGLTSGCLSSIRASIPTPAPTWAARAAP